MDPLDSKIKYTGDEFDGIHEIYVGFMRIIRKVYGILVI